LERSGVGKTKDTFLFGEIKKIEVQKDLREKIGSIVLFTPDKHWVLDRLIDADAFLGKIQSASPAAAIENKLYQSPIPRRALRNIGFCVLIYFVLYQLLFHGKHRGTVSDSVSYIWVEQAKPEAGFVLSFPGTPESVTSQIPTTYGTVDMHTLRVQPKTMGAVFEIDYASFTHVLVSLDETDGLFDRSRDVMVAAGKQSFGGTPEVLNEKHTTIQGMPARTFTLKINKMDARIQMIIAQNRFYKLMTVSASPENTETFFHSFHLQ
jgi:hypothetical protein